MGKGEMTVPGASGSPSGWSCSPHPSTSISCRLLRYDGKIFSSSNTLCSYDWIHLSWPQSRPGPCAPFRKDTHQAYASHLAFYLLQLLPYPVHLLLPVDRLNYSPRGISCPKSLTQPKIQSLGGKGASAYQGSHSLLCLFMFSLPLKSFKISGIWVSEW